MTFIAILRFTRPGDSYQATHDLDELGVVFYGGMFGDRTDHFREGL